MIRLRKDYSNSDVKEGWRRQGDQWKSPQMSRRKARRTSMMGTKAGRRQAGCRKTMGSE